jgi:hypothetical protein
MTDSQKPESQPPRTCGGCKWHKDTQLITGFCRFPLPISIPEGMYPLAHKDWDATRCPCFTAKEAQ